MHPFVHAFTPAIDPPWETKTDFDVFHLLAQEFSRQAKTHLGVRRDLVSVPLQHDTPGQLAQPGGIVRDWRDTSVPAVPGQNMPIFSVVERDYTADRGQAGRRRAAGRQARLHRQERHLRTRRRPLERLSRCNGVMLGGAADGRPAIDTDAKMAEAILAFSGTTNGARRAGPTPCRRRTEGGDLSEGSEEKRITFAQTQAAPVPGDHLARVVGLRDRRPALRAVHHQHRAAEAVAHPDRADALLPRPRLDVTTGDSHPPAAGNVPAIRGRELGPDGRQVGGGALPDAALQVVDPLRVPGQPAACSRCRRGGPTVWLSAADAASIERRGQRLGRAHERQRRARRPGRSSATGCRTASSTCSTRRSAPSTCPSRRPPAQRGGIHNSVTRLLLKPTAPDRRLRPADLRVQLPRPHRGAARHGLHRPPSLAGGARTDACDGPGGHGDEPRQVHRLPHVLGHVQAGLDQPCRHRVRLVQQRRDPPRAGLSASLRGPGEVAAAAGCCTSAASWCSRPAAG